MDDRHCGAHRCSAAPDVVGHVHAVEQIVLLTGNGPTQIEILVLGKLTTLVRVEDGGRCQGRELQPVPAVKRKFDNALIVNDLPCSCAFGLPMKK